MLNKLLSKFRYRISRRACKSLERMRPTYRERVSNFIDGLLFIRTFREKSLLRKLHSEVVKGEEFHIDRVKGITRIENSPTITNQAVEFANRCLREYLSSGALKLNSKDYLRQIWNLSKVDKESAFLLEWAISAPVLKSVSRYMKKFPILHDISVFYSPASSQMGEWKGSQLFHRDGGGTQSTKLWILCNEVQTDNGPTVLMPADLTAALTSQLSYRPGDRITDDSLLSSGLEKCVSLTGKSGTWYATDTDRCFHYGSRTTLASERLVIMFHFVDNNSTYYLPWIHYNYSRKYWKLNHLGREVLKVNKFGEYSLQLR